MSSMGKANAALAAAVIFLLLSGGAAYLAFSRLYASEGWVHHTRDVQSTFAQFSMTMSRAARLRAEFIDSGDLSILQRQAEVVQQVRNTLSSIRQMTADNAQEQANCAKLSQLTEERIDLMNQAIELKKSGQSTLTAQAKITRDIVSTAEDSDELLQAMYDQETELLSQRQSRVRRTSTLLEVILVASFALAVGLFVVHHRLITDEVRARSRAEAAQRTISAKLLTVQDEERRKFARELHDSVGQHLAALKMAISILIRKLPPDPMLQDCIRMIDDSISETRTISHLLHPPLLDEAGLNSASRWFVEGFAERSGIDVHLDISEQLPRLTEPTELVLFRVLQESLTNVHRHSGAKRADVSLRPEGTSAVLRVKDYGRGIAPVVLEKLQEDGASGGVGLAGMKERVREIGGIIEMNSSTSGTELTVRVPALRKPSNHASLSITEHEVKQ